jgi:hypothetical protein
MELNPTILTTISPLLIFTEIGFTIFLAIPSLRTEIKARLDKVYSEQKRIRPIDFLILDFYLNFSRSLLPLSFMYFIAGVFLLLSPITDVQTFFSGLGVSVAFDIWGYILTTFTTLIVFFVATRALADSAVKTMRVAEISLTSLNGTSGSSNAPTCSTK